MHRLFYFSTTWWKKHYMNERMCWMLRPISHHRYRSCYRYTSMTFLSHTLPNNVFYLRLFLFTFMNIFNSSYPVKVKMEKHIFFFFVMLQKICRGLHESFWGSSWRSERKSWEFVALWLRWYCIYVCIYFTFNNTYLN